MSQQHRLIARAGLASAMMILTCAMGLLAHQAFTTTAPAVRVNPPGPEFAVPAAGAPAPTRAVGG